MTEGKESVCVYRGSLIDVSYYKERLEEMNISSFVRDDFHDGFREVQPNSAELIVDADNADKAIEGIKSFKE